MKVSAITPDRRVATKETAKNGVGGVEHRDTEDENEGGDFGTRENGDD